MRHVWGRYTKCTIRLDGFSIYSSSIQSISEIIVRDYVYRTRVNLDKGIREEGASHNECHLSSFQIKPRTKVPDSHLHDDISLLVHEFEIIEFHYGSLVVLVLSINIFTPWELSVKELKNICVVFSGFHHDFKTWKSCTL